jgi:F0F1-type ATP synthase membrane subunit b/b'
MHGEDASVAELGKNDAQQAEDASRQLLAKARYDAFRLMTEARDEAETILDEAKAEAAGTKHAAEITAASTAENADTKAEEIIEAAREEAAAIVAGAHRTAGEQTLSADGDQLEVEHQALSDRVSTLRTLASQLEDRFAALASTAGAPSPDPTPEAADTQAPDAEIPVTNAPTIDNSPSVISTSKDKAESESGDTDQRESFYNRRSAKLPRLGEDGGRSALNMTRMMRESLEDK